VKNALLVVILVVLCEPNCFVLLWPASMCLSHGAALSLPGSSGPFPGLKIWLFGQVRRRERRVWKMSVGPLPAANQRQAAANQSQIPVWRGRQTRTVLSTCLAWAVQTTPSMKSTMVWI
jgi:hypothetical protein